MYPYRRSNQRKRNRNNTARHNKGAGGRRLPGSARELLPMLQPATKALAQVLAGNAKASGQFVHARNVVDRADQLIAEKQLDRMSTRDREEFLEQLARLKLTVSDAEEEFGPIEASDEDAEAEGEEGAPEEAAGALDDETRRAQEEEERRRAEAAAAEEQERLRRVALALMTPSSEAPVPKRGAPQHEDYMPVGEEAAPARPRREAAARAGGRGGGASRRPRITLRAQERDAAGETEPGDEGVVSDG
ncbi:MAG: hypothetical protein ACLFTG_13055 [Alphaproteobacteria bacterium]